MLELSYEEKDGFVAESFTAGQYSGSQKIPLLQGLSSSLHPSQKWAISKILAPNTQSLDKQHAKEIKLADFFCGPGGFTQGIKEACQLLGWSLRTEIACDFSKKPLSIYQSNHRPRAKLLENVGNLFESVKYVDVGGLRVLDLKAMRLVPELEKLKGIDLFVAGPPCEGNSKLNNLTRGADQRNELYLFAVAVAIKLGARALAIENVPTVINASENVVERALKMLELNGYAYENATRVLRADDFLVAQSRARHFLLSVKGKKVLPDIDSDKVNAEKVTSGQLLGALESLSLTDPVMDAVGQSSDETIRRIKFLHDNDLYNLPDSERPPCHRDKEHNYASVYGRMYPDLPAPTLTTGFLSPGRGRYTHPTIPRPLTLREGAALQSFPLNYKWRRPGELISKVDCSSAIGDAVPPLLAKFVGLQVLTQI